MIIDYKFKKYITKIHTWINGFGWSIKEERPLIHDFQFTPPYPKSRYKILWGYWPNQEHYGKLPIIYDGTEYFCRWKNLITKSSWWIKVNYYEGKIIPLP